MTDDKHDDDTSDTMPVGREERLARNRKRDLLRRNRKQNALETMMVTRKDLESKNDILRKKNAALIQELATYGLVYGLVRGEDDNPSRMAYKKENIPCASPSRFFLDTWQQRLNLMNRHSSEIRTDVPRAVYSQPLQNMMAPMTRSTCLHGGMPPDNIASQQTANDSMDPWQQHLQDEAETISILTDLVHSPSTHKIQTLHPQLRNGILMSRDAYIERNLRNLSPNKTSVRAIQKQYQRKYSQFDKLCNRHLDGMFSEEERCSNSSIGTCDSIRY